MIIPKVFTLNLNAMFLWLKTKDREQELAAASVLLGMNMYEILAPGSLLVTCVALLIEMQCNGFYPVPVQNDDISASNDASACAPSLTRSHL